MRLVSSPSNLMETINCLMQKFKNHIVIYRQNVLFENHHFKLLTFVIKDIFFVNISSTSAGLFLQITIPISVVEKCYAFMTKIAALSAFF